LRQGAAPVNLAPGHFADVFADVWRIAEKRDLSHYLTFAAILTLKMPFRPVFGQLRASGTRIRVFTKPQNYGF
jgi:hypothetical protein